MNKTQKADYEANKKDPRWDSYEEYFIGSWEGCKAPQPMGFAQWVRWA
jgi:hypothetical protein